MLPYYLTAMGFPRNRLGDRNETLNNWLETHCPFLSGYDKRYFDRKGDMDLQWQYYYTDLKLDNPECEPLSRQKFAQVCERENIGLRQPSTS
jgi:hypothetical protein